MARVLHCAPRRRSRAGAVIGAGLAWAFGSCVAGATSPVPPPPSPIPQASTAQLKAVVDAARADAARRSGREESAIKVLTAEPVTWGDGSLGCPEEGVNYTQALVPGFRVRIGTGEKAWLEYHAGADGKPFYCPPGRVLEPVPDNGI